MENEVWLEVSDIARGVGFQTAVQIGVALNDALQPLQNEIDGDYDQRLYDVLWQAHLRLSLDHGKSVTFNFFFARKNCKMEDISAVSLQVRVDALKQVVLLSSPRDF